MSEERRREQLCQLLRSYASGYDALHKDIAADFREAAELLLSRPTPPAADRVSLAGTEGLVQRLSRDAALLREDGLVWNPDDLEQAAAALAGLARENARIKAALNDTAIALDYLRTTNDGRKMKYIATEHGSRLRIVGVIESARAALQEPPDA